MLDGDRGAVELFGVTLVGVSVTTGVKLVLTVGVVLGVLVLRRLAIGVARRLLGGDVADARRFWVRQGVQVVTTVVMVLLLISVWITPGTDITTGIGLLSAGLAFALQQVVLSLAAYVVILRGDTFSVGDRITLGGVRGDVVRLGFLKTTIMEMGQPPAVSSTDPAVWVGSRQYTGRLVTVTNGVIFGEPVYNYTREFPYLWEEIVLPIPFGADRAQAEAILLAAARDHAEVGDEVAEVAMLDMRSRYALSDASVVPAVYVRITDSWVELALRFLVNPRGVRDVKDAMSRQVLDELDAAGISIASATYDIGAMPTVAVTSADEAPPTSTT
jgi:small-conductance mechanosensitive channel